MRSLCYAQKHNLFIARKVKRRGGRWNLKVNTEFRGKVVKSGQTSRR